MPQILRNTQLVDEVAARTGLPKAQAKRAVEAVVEVLGERLADGDRVQIGGLGTFEVRERAARQATNPRTREKIQVPPSRAVGFRAASALRTRVDSTQE